MATRASRILRPKAFRSGNQVNDEAVSGSGGGINGLGNGGRGNAVCGEVGFGFGMPEGWITLGLLELGLSRGLSKCG